MQQPTSTETPTITSLSSFLTWVRELQNLPKDNPIQAFFYRGHSDKKYTQTLTASAYRETEAGKSYRKDESRMYQEMFRRDPSAFLEDATTFDRLVRMQHHGLPTRLLDITSNPLVALYFAVEDEKNSSSDGHVLAFNITHTDVLHQGHIPEIALSGIEHPITLSSLAGDILSSYAQHLNNENRRLGKRDGIDTEYWHLVKSCTEKIDLILKNNNDLMIICAFLRHLDNDVDSFFRTQEKDLENMRKSNPDDINTLERLRNLYDFRDGMTNFHKNHVSILCKQMHIRNDFENDRLDQFLGRLTFYFFVYPPMNSERIRRQQGAFIICPAIQTNNWTLTHFAAPKTATIESAAKPALLKELAQVGITRNFLFPELTEQAKHIQEIYTKRR